MKIIVCGAGQVGFNIARHLSMESNDVTVVDQAPDRIRMINDTIDATGFLGHSRLSRLVPNGKRQKKQ